jgi:hypothetical protein
MTPSEFIGKFKSKYLWYNLAAMFVVVIILCTAVRFGLNIYTHHGESIIVPNLKHKSFDEAKEILDHLGIEAVVGDTGYVKALKPDCVLEQSIAPGERVKSGHVIYLVINSSHTPTLSLLANTRVGVKHSHTQAVFRVATDVAFYSALIFDEVSPHQSIIATMCGFIEELLAKACLSIRSLGNNEESACIFIYTMY